MKKFVFRLQTLLKVKEAIEKQQKAHLAMVQQKLYALIDELEFLRDKRNALNEQYQQEASQGMRSDIMHIYLRYFDHLRDMIYETVVKIEEVRKEKARAQAALLRTMKEIKALKKLKEAQYKEYLAEVAKEEADAINEMVSFKAAAGGS